MAHSRRNGPAQSLLFGNRVGLGGNVIAGQIRPLFRPSKLMVASTCVPPARASCS
jgi:hypothetical protein